MEHGVGRDGWVVLNDTRRRLCSLMQSIDKWQTNESIGLRV